MTLLLQLFIGAIALAFLFYGYNCLFSTRLVEEFDRFQLTATQRKITGIVQIAGALGLLFGLLYFPVGFFASLGLSVLMLLGFLIRLKVKDSFTASAPSFILIFINGYFFYCFGALLEYW
ncbi:DoxX family protein [Rasiella sp. SM2506]|uniref:DoxX family protein n=1 Tax=Rasiella sp. SM2506 TaxID=3423914 RepID=UPI003D78F814